MRKQITILVVLVAVVALTAVPAVAITWGERDSAHTYVGAMVVDSPVYGPWQFCSGTLIHPRVFLTAAHCTDAAIERGYERVWVNFEDYAIDPDGLRLVEQVLSHPDYAWGGSDPHDIGLLVLAESVEDIAPAQLPYEGFLNDLKKDGLLRTGSQGTKFTLVGYGGTLSWPPPEVFYEDYRQVAYSEYIALTKPWLHMSQNLLKGDSGTCFGDSGGPAFYTLPDGTEVVVGVTSWGDSQCVAIGFNYRVDISASLSFIADTIAGLE